MQEVTPNEMSNVFKDDIFPLHEFDDTALNRVMAVTGMMRFASVLDGEKLRAALTTLFEMGEWKKLRGRLRLNSLGKLEIHVPATVTPERPAIRFKQTQLDQPIESHPILSKLAQPTRKSKVQHAIASFPYDISSILVPEDWPRSIQDYTDPTKDEPIFGLHIVSLNNATIVVLKYSHVIMDGGGRGPLMKAWSNVLNGRQDLVPLIGGTRADPLNVIRQLTKSIEPFVLADKRIALSALMPEDDSAPPRDPNWDTSSPESCWRTLSFSADALSCIFSEAKTSMPTSTDGTKKFASEDDIITAWLIREIAKLLPETRPLNSMRVYNLRSRLPVFEAGTAYVQNAYQMAWTLFESARDAGSSTLGEVATRLRATLQEQTTEQQVLAAIKEREKAATPLYGDPSGMFLTFNSWTKIKLYSLIDFSSAIIAPSKSKDQFKETGLPDLIDFDFALGGAPPGPNIITSGKDADGTLHAMVFLSNTMWPKMEASIEQMG